MEKSLLCFKLSLYLQFEQCIYIMISFIMYICLCVSSKGRIYKELWELRWSRHLFHLGNTGHNFREAECELDIEEENVLLMERKAFLRKGMIWVLDAVEKTLLEFQVFQFGVDCFLRLIWVRRFWFGFPSNLTLRQRFGCLQVVYLEITFKKYKWGSKTVKGRHLINGNLSSQRTLCMART